MSVPEEPRSWASQSDLLIPAYGVHERKDAPARDLIDAVEAAGWPTYVLPGAPTDKAGFVASVADVLPLDPPLESANWDGLRDSLFGGIEALGVERVAIVWPDSERLRRANREAYQIAVEIPTDAVFVLADPKFTGGNVTRLLVLLA